MIDEYFDMLISENWNWTHSVEANEDIKMYFMIKKFKWSINEYLEAPLDYINKMYRIMLLDIQREQRKTK